MLSLSKNKKNLKGNKKGFLDSFCAHEELLTCKIYSPVII